MKQQKKNTQKQEEFNEQLKGDFLYIIYFSIHFWSFRIGKRSENEQ